MLKTSLLIKQQLPSFIRDNEDYSGFISFVEAYYEWLEQEKNVIAKSHNLLEYVDIDATLDEFIDYFYNNFMPAFPTEIAADKRKIIRFSKELYENKGNRAAYKFLFRSLYNSHSDVFETKEYVLKASAGKWFLPKSVKLKTNDSRWINTETLFLFGEKSKSIAKIERAKLVNDKTEIFISDIQRLFQTGEFVKVVDVRLNDVYFDVDGNIVEEGELLTAKLLGVISSVNINRNYRGNYYLSGDPVVFYGGIEDELTGIGASAQIGEVTLGAIKSVSVENGSWGYRETPNTFIYVTPDSGKPILTVGSVNPANVVNVSFAVVDTLELKENVSINCNLETGFPVDLNADYGFSNTTSLGLICNANTVMADAFTFTQFPTYSIETVIVQNGGGGFRSKPKIEAESMYETDLPFGTGDQYDPRYAPTGTSNTFTSLKSLGILGPILFRKDSSGNRINGVGYNVGDEIGFSGGLGTGAFARVDGVLSGGAIDAVSYYTRSDYLTPPGGYAYSSKNLPNVYVIPNKISGNVEVDSVVITVDPDFVVDNVKIGQTVSGNGISDGTTVINSYSNGWIILSNTSTETYSANEYSFVGTGAELYVDTVLGDSAKLIPITDRIGAVTTIKITNYGEDYVSNPFVSLKVQDIAVSNVSLLSLPQKGDVLYQGTSSDVFTYKSYVDSVTRMTFDAESEDSTYVIRSYNYNRIPNPNTTLILEKTKLIEDNTFPLTIKTDYSYPKKRLLDGTEEIVGSNGILTYGDGTAKANSKFLNGLILGQGRYIDQSHQPSSYSVLEGENYNNFTYVVSVEKEIAEYRELLYKIMHPAGTKVIGQTVIKGEVNSQIDLVDSTFTDTLQDFDYIWAALATEESDENEYTSELMRFPESIKKYAYLESNNTNLLHISTFPDIFNGQKIYGIGIPWDSVVTKTEAINNKVYISNNLEQNQTDSFAIVVDYLSDNYNKFAIPFEIVKCSFEENSNVITVSTLSTSLISDVVKNQIVVGNTTTIYANVVNNSNMLQQVEDVSGIVIGQTISANNVPVGTVVIDIIESNNTIIMSNDGTGNSNGWLYQTRDKSTGSYIDNYKYNYIQFQSVPYNTRISEIIEANNTLVLSNNCLKSINDDTYYLLGDGGDERDSESPSEFVRVETGQFVEKYGTIGGKRRVYEDDYFKFDDIIQTESGETLTDESSREISTTIYIRIR